MAEKALQEIEAESEKRLRPYLDAVTPLIKTLDLGSIGFIYGSLGKCFNEGYKLGCQSAAKLYIEGHDREIVEHYSKFKSKT